MSRSFPQIFFNHLPWLRRCLNICNRRCAVSWFWPQHDLTKCTDSDGVLHPPLVLHYLQRGLDSSFQTSSSSTWGPLPFMQTFDLQRNLWNRLEAEMEVGELAKWSISRVLWKFVTLVCRQTKMPTPTTSSTTNTHHCKPTHYCQSPLPLQRPTIPWWVVAVGDSRGFAAVGSGSRVCQRLVVA